MSCCSISFIRRKINSLKNLYYRIICIFRNQINYYYSIKQLLEYKHLPYKGNVLEVNYEATYPMAMSYRR